MLQGLICEKFSIYVIQTYIHTYIHTYIRGYADTYIRLIFFSWEEFTDSVVRELGKRKGLVYLLWGKPAQLKYVTDGF